MSVKPEDLSGEARRRYDTWRSLGMSESSAMQQLREEGLVEADPFDEQLRLFRTLGLSEAAARTAAIGRDGSESGARRRLREAGAGVAAVPSAAVEAENARLVEVVEELAEAGAGVAAVPSAAVEAENARLVEVVQELAEAKRQHASLALERGETREQVALRQAAWQVIEGMPTMPMKLRVVGVLEAHFGSRLDLFAASRRQAAASKKSTGKPGKRRR